MGCPIDSQEEFDRFAAVLKSSLRGARLQYPYERGGGNLYLLLGNSTEGFDEAPPASCSPFSAM